MNKLRREHAFIGEGLAFDDVLIVPAYSELAPGGVDASVRLTDAITLNAPILSAGMDTVTESKMAIAVARCGGMGIIHRHMPPEVQAVEVDRVKRSENGVITDPFHLSPNHYVYEAAELMAKYQISGVPITELGRLVGIVTNRDLRFESDMNKKIYEIMTSEGLITAPVGTTLEEARLILTLHKVEKLPIVDEKFNLKGLITVKDIRKQEQYPNSAKDSQGRLLVGAAVGVGEDTMERVEALVKARADLLAVDALHGHTGRAIALIREIKAAYPGVPVMAGNAVTAEAVKALIAAGADVLKVGVGASSVSTSRVVAGVGVPQVTAVMDCAAEAGKHGVPIVADGGIRYSGDITKAIAAGAHACMIGNLFAGCDESPGTTELFHGRKYKTYRGTESVDTAIPEGVEGRAAYKGAVADVVKILMGGLSAGMAYCGCANVEQMHQSAKFIKITRAGLTESHPHDIQITKETANYSME